MSISNNHPRTEKRRQSLAVSFRQDQRVTTAEEVEIILEDMV
jgi:hypothetical protein